MKIKKITAKCDGCSRGKARDFTWEFYANKETLEMVKNQTNDKGKKCLKKIQTIPSIIN